MISGYRFLSLVFLFAAHVSFAHSAPAHTSRVESQRGEKWWGVFVGNSPEQPFSEPFTVRIDGLSTDGVRIPMLVSSAGRYIRSNHPMTVEFDGNDFSIASDHEKVTVQKGGRNLREAYLVCCHKHFAPDGTLPPLGLLTDIVYNTRLEYGYMATQEDILSYADKILSEGLPPGTILLSDGWRAYNGTYDFDRQYFPDPRAMTDRLHAQGFKLMLTLTPFTGAFGRSYVQGVENGLFLTGADGRPMVFETEGGYSVCFDLARTETAGMLRGRIDALRTGYGVDGFRFDCRTLLPQLADGGIPDAIRFLRHWNSLSDGIALAEYVPGSSVPLAPAVQGMPVDRCPPQELLRGTLCHALSAGLAGSLYVHPTGGASAAGSGISGRDDRSLVRMLQMGVMMPVAEVAFGPWRIADPVLREAAKKAILVRAGMADYVAGLVRESARTAEPLLRHMEYQFPRNGFSDCNDQFMIGTKYLIAPAVDDAPTRIVRLPRGVWTDAQGRRFKGPVVTTVDVRDGRLVYFELSGK